MVNKLIKTALNVKTRLAAEDCVPCARAVLLLVGFLEGILEFILSESRGTKRQCYS